MTCVVCGASAGRSRSRCALCGYALKPDVAPLWGRDPESEVYEDLHPALAEGEELLGFTRGRAGGAWRRQISLNPQAFLSQYVNLAITTDRLLLQQVSGESGRALSDMPASLALQQVLSISVSDADPMETGKMARLVVQLSNGESFRVRAAGRLARGARNVEAVWQALRGDHSSHTVRELHCAHCERLLDRFYRFCPYCGRENAVTFTAESPEESLDFTHGGASGLSNGGVNGSENGVEDYSPMAPTTSRFDHSHDFNDPAGDD